jgi:hypothetical protein
LVGVFVSDAFKRGFSSSLAHSWVCAIGIILPELEQEDPKLGWEFLFKHDSMLGVIICFLTTTQVSTTSNGHLLFIVQTWYVYSTQYLILGCVKEVDKFNITHLNVES